MKKNSLLFMLMIMIMLFISEKVCAQNVPYVVHTYNPAHPTLNPFKKSGGTAISWYQHMQNVDADQLTYLDPIVGTKSKYLTEAATCLNYNLTKLGGGTQRLTSDNAEYILSKSVPVIVNLPAGSIFVLGTDPATGKVAGFYNPEYREVAMLQYTAPNGRKFYVSKYSGADKECCINLVIDLNPREADAPNVVEHSVHDTMFITKEVLVPGQDHYIHDGDVVNNNYYNNEYNSFPQQNYGYNYGGGYGYYQPFISFTPTFVPTTTGCNSCGVAPSNTVNNITVGGSNTTVALTNYIYNDNTVYIKTGTPRPTTTPIGINTGPGVDPGSTGSNTGPGNDQGSTGSNTGPGSIIGTRGSNTGPGNDQVSTGTNTGARLANPNPTATGIGTADRTTEYKPYSTSVDRGIVTANNTTRDDRPASSETYYGQKEREAQVLRNQQQEQSNTSNRDSRSQPTQDRQYEQRNSNERQNYNSNRQYEASPREQQRGNQNYDQHQQPRQSSQQPQQQYVDRGASREYRGSYGGGNSNAGNSNVGRQSGGYGGGGYSGGGGSGSQRGGRH